jgi:hypothetical protein
MSHLAKRLTELFDEIVTIDDYGRLLKDDDTFEVLEAKNASEELWEQYDGIRNYLPFVFPYGPRDCLILAVAAAHYAEVLRQAHPETTEFEQTEELLKRTLERIITGLLEYVEEAGTDIDMRELLRNTVADRNKAAVSVYNRILQKEHENAGTDKATCNKTDNVDNGNASAARPNGEASDAVQ